MKIEKIEQQKKDFLPLLLLADDEPHIEQYLEESELFVLSDPHPIGVFVINNKEGGLFEIENFAIAEEFQKRGYGRKFMVEMMKLYQNKAEQIIVGTDDVSGNVQFYEKCGFTYFKKSANYFVKQYEQPIFEKEFQLKDKIFLMKKNSRKENLK